MFEIREQYDIRRFSFDQFVDFVFDHETTPEISENGKRTKPWYYDAEVEFVESEVIAHYKQLFSEPAFLLDKFSREMLEQGFWAIMSGPLDCAVAEVIWDSSVEFESRKACVRSMFHLYEKFYAKDFLFTSGEMWWDAIAYDWHCGNRDRSQGGEDLLMQDVMFETLSKIVQLESPQCQFAALHGLGHLHHPRTREIVDEYLASSSADIGMRDYAEAAARFEVL